jgi:glyoxalase family protein
MVKTLRISHPAFFGTKLDETIRFYTEILGMEIVLRQPNLDDASMEHLFFHVGEDNFIAYFLTRDPTTGPRYSQARPGVGGMNHLALDVDAAGFESALERLRAEGIDVRGPVDRGYERSIYFKDPNGVRIELLVWLSPPPADLSQADIIRRAQQIRAARGAAFVEDEDARQAIAELIAERTRISDGGTTSG